MMHSPMTDARLTPPKDDAIGRVLSSGIVSPTDILYENILFGNEAEAIRQQRILMHMFRPEEASLIDHIDGFAILRTTARLAARSGGVPVEATHKITQAYRARAFQLRTAQEFEQLSEDFIIEICKLVRFFRSKGLSPMVAQCVDVILAYAQQPLTVKQIAERIGTNSNHLSGQFKQEVGMSITQYRQEIRLEYATHLLDIPAISLTDAALFAGFSSQSYFTKVFREQYAITPQEYRNKRKA